MNKSSGGQIAAQYSNPRNVVTRIGASIAALFHHNTCCRSFSNVKFLYPLPFDFGGSWPTPLLLIFQHRSIYFTHLRIIVSLLNLPFNLISVVLISSINFLSCTLPAFLNSFSVSAGLRNVFCLLCISLK